MKVGMELPRKLEENRVAFWEIFETLKVELKKNLRIFEKEKIIRDMKLAIIQMLKKKIFFKSKKWLALEVQS